MHQHDTILIVSNASRWIGTSDRGDTHFSQFGGEFENIDAPRETCHAQGYVWWAKCGKYHGLTADVLENALAEV